MLRTASFALAVAALFAAAPAIAETLTYTTDMSAANEVPPNTSKGMGHVDATYDSATKTLSWTVDYKDLTGGATMAHFHGPAPVGKNAGVAIPITGSLDSPIKGTAVLTDEQATAFAGGQMYFNIHTPANKGGEIRGQLAKAM